ncbi:DUF6907 domain-containing protein [Streptomyces sp. NPDC015131]|uniref:DUF6907 domain-containing protein n=1 Tax=Streptomyces sp. NPDC015131 TaxID=3364941 RepID=UPI00370063F4
MSARMVTIPTMDHGDVTIPCPAWCTQQYHQAGGARVDITHTGQDVPLYVPTPEGKSPLLALMLEQRPFTEMDPGRDVFVSVELLAGPHPMDPVALDALAAALVDNAREVRAMARRLAVLKAAR